MTINNIKTEKHQISTTFNSCILFYISLYVVTYFNCYGPTLEIRTSETNPPTKINHHPIPKPVTYWQGGHKSQRAGRLYLHQAQP